MNKKRWLKGLICITPNLVSSIEEDNRGIHLYYATNKPWSLYIGKFRIYRKQELMRSVREGWGLEANSLMPLQKQLDSYLAVKTKTPFILQIKEQEIPFFYEEAFLLRQQIEGMPVQKPAPRTTE